MVTEIRPLSKHGGDKRDRTIKCGKAGTTGEYLIARIKRDRPDITERLANGEFPSIAAAARAAGIDYQSRRKHYALTMLRSFWRKATEEEREIFRREILEEQNRSPLVPSFAARL
jgi:hypothetical protein